MARQDLIAFAAFLVLTGATAATAQPSQNPSGRAIESLDVGPPPEEELDGGSNFGIGGGNALRAPIPSTRPDDRADLDDKDGWHRRSARGGFRIMTQATGGYHGSRPRVRTLTSERSFTYEADTAGYSGAVPSWQWLSFDAPLVSLSAPQIIDVERGRLDGLRYEADGLQVTSRGGPKIIRIADWSDEARNVSRRQRAETVGSIRRQEKPCGGWKVIAGGLGQASVGRSADRCD